MVTALATGILFGLVPAFVSMSTASNALREGGRHGGSRRLHRLLNTLVVAEVALSLVLLAGAGLLMRSLIKLQRNDLGFRAEGVLTAGVQLPATHYPRPAPSSANPFRALPRCRAFSTRLAPPVSRRRSPASARVSGASIGRSRRMASCRPAMCGPSHPGSSRGWEFRRWPDVTSPMQTPWRHFTSWLTLAPKNKVSGGRLFSSRTQPSANRAAAMLRLAATRPGPHADPRSARSIVD
jgi:hypothetical protein